MDYFSGLTFLFGHANNSVASGFVDLTGRQYYCLQYNHGGVITVQVGTNSPVRVTGPSLLITYPGENFLFGSGEQGTWLHNAIGFKGEQVLGLIDSGLLPVAQMPPVFPVRDSAGFHALFKQCCHYISLGERFRHRALYCFEGLLLQLYDERRDDKPVSDLRAQISSLTEELLRNYREDVDFPALADGLHVSYAHFRRLFKDVIGISPQRYMIQVRLSKSAELLLTGSQSVKEVARAIGIEDVHYFTRLFSRHYRISPAKFRQAHGIKPFTS